MVGFWLLMRDAHLWSLALLLAFGCSDSPKSVAASSQSHLPSFLPAFSYSISAADAGLFRLVSLPGRDRLAEEFSSICFFGCRGFELIGN